MVEEVLIIPTAPQSVDYAAGNGRRARPPLPCGHDYLRTDPLAYPPRCAAPFGEHLRHWRQHRRLSQLDLAQEADISTRHLSFVETGRASPSPSREMVLRLLRRRCVR